MEKILNIVKKKIKFLASIFQLKHSLCSNLGVSCFKISSGEVFNNEILNVLIKNKCELIISNGLINEEKLRILINKLKKIK